MKFDTAEKSDFAQGTGFARPKLPAQIGRIRRVNAPGNRIFTACKFRDGLSSENLRERNMDLSSVPEDRLLRRAELVSYVRKISGVELSDPAVNWLVKKGIFPSARRRVGQQLYTKNHLMIGIDVALMLADGSTIDEAGSRLNQIVINLQPGIVLTIDRTIIPEALDPVLVINACTEAVAKLWR